MKKIFKKKIVSLIQRSEITLIQNHTELKKLMKRIKGGESMFANKPSNRSPVRE